MIPHFKLIAYGVIAAVAISIGIYAKVIYNKAQRVPELEQRIAQLEAGIDSANKASEGYQNEIALLRVARGPVPVVRVRVNPVKVDPAPQPRPDETCPASEEFPQEAGRDIGPEIYALADDADDLAAQLRALQEYVRALPAN